jgi:DNA polymerase-1
MKVLIDADIVAYRTAAVNEKAEFSLAKWQADQLITRIIEDVNASDWALFLTSGNNNFRYNIYPAYKANRKDQPKPKHLEQLREHLVLDWEAQLVDGYEADDAIGIASSESGCIIGSIDKDLRQLPGLHYDFVKRRIFEISSGEGATNFYRQLLVGDSTDNIKGCPGTGPVGADKALHACSSVGEMYSTCATLYKKVFPDTWEKELDICAQLLYIWRTENDNWQRLLKPPIESLKQEGAQTQSSLPKQPTTLSESTTAEKPDGFQPDGF